MERGNRSRTSTNDWSAAGHRGSPKVGGLFMPIVMLRHALLLPLVLVGSVAVAAPDLLGQQGPTTALLQGGALQLSTRRTAERFPDGNRIWKVELHRGSRLLASWPAASGVAGRQTADRRWSPGNAAPLPAGEYSLGRPEPWGNDLWFDLTPRFDTTRSALGIHRCYPGTGCICIPKRADIDALASWVKASGIRTLKVVN